MGMREIFEAVTSAFARERMEYAVIGAFALYGMGYVRATRDVDFVTRLQYQGKVKTFLEQLGCEMTHCSTAFSNHVHPVGSVRVDIMYLDGPTADQVFASVQEREVFKGNKVPVVSPEHLVAMKLFAAGSNPARRLKDLSDVREIVSRVKVDREFLRKHLDKNGLGTYYGDIVGSG